MAIELKYQELEQIELDDNETPRSVRTGQQVSVVPVGLPNLTLSAKSEEEAKRLIHAKRLMPIKRLFGENDEDYEERNQDYEELKRADAYFMSPPKNNENSGVFVFSYLRIH